jgi:DNA-binding NarL/FixJ family response regulator
MNNLQVKQVKVPQEVIETIQTIESGNLGNIKMNFENGNFEFHAESSDGQEKIIIKKQYIPGIILENKISVQKTNSIEERRERVLHFHKEGLSQTKIADLTMTSQKTVSNDIKSLKDMGKLK